MHSERKYDKHFTQVFLAYSNIVHKIVFFPPLLLLSPDN